MEMSRGRVELMELLKKEREVRFPSLQTTVGKGPATLALERSRE